MLKFLSLSSGSSGNCYFLSNGSRGLLIDAGVSLRRLKRGLGEYGFGEYGFGLDAFQAVLVTHDHLDHIRHLGSYCKRLRVPVFTTRTLQEALLRHTFTRDCMASCRHDLDEAGETRIFRELGCDGGDGPSVHCFVVPHDATQTVGYAIHWEGRRFVLMTDMGRMTEEALEYGRSADTVVIESNYDMGMLIGGPYTHELKMRICQGNGHLSNEECARAIREFWHPGLRNLFLCHLSDNNNTPALACESAAAALRSIRTEDGGTAEERTRFEPLPRGRASRLFDL